MNACSIGRRWRQAKDGVEAMPRAKDSGRAAAETGGGQAPESSGGRGAN